jgi:hypothetical protein
METASETQDSGISLPVAPENSMVSPISLVQRTPIDEVPE